MVVPVACYARLGSFESTTLDNIVLSEDFMTGASSSQQLDVVSRPAAALQPLSVFADPRGDRSGFGVPDFGPPPVHNSVRAFTFHLSV